MKFLITDAIYNSVLQNTHGAVRMEVTLKAIPWVGMSIVGLICHEIKDTVIKMGLTDTTIRFAIIAGIGGAVCGMIAGPIKWKLEGQNGNPISWMLIGAIIMSLHWAIMGAAVGVIVFATG
jgi:hypothetical protein